MIPMALPLPVLGFLAVHHALRAETAIIERLVATGRVRAARRRARLVARVLGNHHRAEDALLWPLLVRHDPALAGVLQVLEQEHLALDRLLDRLPRDPWLADELGRRLEAHLAAEERHAIPVWVSALDHEGHERFARELRRHTGWRDAGLMVAWLLDHAPAGVDAIALPHVPRGARLAHRIWWRRRYEWRWGRVTDTAFATAA